MLYRIARSPLVYMANNPGSFRLRNHCGFFLVIKNAPSPFSPFWKFDIWLSDFIIADASFFAIQHVMFGWKNRWIFLLLCLVAHSIFLFIQKVMPSLDTPFPEVIFTKLKTLSSVKKSFELIAQTQTFYLSKWKKKFIFILHQTPPGILLCKLYSGVLISRYGFK